MAELAISAFAAMTAAAPAAAGAAGAAGAAAGATTLSTLSSVATVASMVSTLVGGYTSYQESQTQADFAGLNAEAARLEAEQNALAVKREYVQRVAATRVAFAGSGLDISSGSAMEDSLGSQAKYEMGLARSAGKMGAASAEAEASQMRARGGSKLLGSAFKAGGTLLDGMIDISKRGV